MKQYTTNKMKKKNTLCRYLEVQGFVPLISRELIKSKLT